MLGIKVVIARYVSDEPQPGIVECHLDDVHGRRWWFIEKTAVVSSEHLDSRTAYPREGVIAGEVVQSLKDQSGRDVICFDTGHPWDVESVDGETRFEVATELLVDF